jgi:hypothetical protein
VFKNILFGALEIMARSDFANAEQRRRNGESDASRYRSESSPTNNAAIARDERAYQEGYAEGQAQESYVEDVQSAQEIGSAGSGRVIGVLLTAVAGLILATAYLMPSRNIVETPEAAPTASPAPTVNPINPTAPTTVSPTVVQPTAQPTVVPAQPSTVQPNVQQVPQAGSVVPTQPVQPPAQPQVVQPQVTQPQATPVQPQVVQPQVAQPQVAQPQVVQPQVAQPQVTQPQVTQPQVAQPQPITPPNSISVPPSPDNPY